MRATHMSQVETPPASRPGKTPQMVSFLRNVQPGERSHGTIHPDWIVGLTLAGRNHSFHPAGDFSQEPSDLMALKPDTPHHWVVPEGSTAWRILYFVVPSRPATDMLLRQLPELRPGIMKLPLGASPVKSRVRAALLNAHSVLNSPYPGRLELATNVMEGALLWCQVELERARTGTDPRVQKAVSHLMRNLAGPIYLEALAKACALSVSRLEALFQKHVGLSPMNFLENERMERARVILVSSQHPVKMVASLVGYDDPVHFAKRFAKRFQASPRQYRLDSRPR